MHGLKCFTMVFFMSAMLRATAVTHQDLIISEYNHPVLKHVDSKFYHSPYSHILPTFDEKITITSVRWEDQQQGCMMCHQRESTPSDKTAEKRDIDTIKKHIAYLTENTLEGRLTGSLGEQLATQYVTDTLRQLGFEGAGDNGSFFQTFYFSAPDDAKKKVASHETFLQS